MSTAPRAQASVRVSLRVRMRVRASWSTMLSFAPPPSRACSGSTGRSSTTILPCTDCLISVADKPPFVVSIADIDHVHFERVSFTNRNFDMVLIFKAGVRERGEDEFVMISAIPMEHLERIKSWLDSVAEVHAPAMRARARARKNVRHPPSVCACPFCVPARVCACS
ncbi:hypothetical protein EON67_03365 [archaeon]|nr:MAG: hypothetical protein EON67_03365 [archaeon]